MVGQRTHAADAGLLRLNAPVAPSPATDDSRVALERAFILHRRPYRESSLLLDALTLRFGKVALIAHGARRFKSKFAGLLQAFFELELSWSGKSELHTLIGAEAAHSPVRLTGIACFCGLYLNELVSRFLHNHDPQPEVFELYRQSLHELARESDPETTLRAFEVNLLQAIGYGLQLEHEVRTGRKIEADRLYAFLPEEGPVEACTGNDLIHGLTLIGLQARRLDHPVARREAKRLMRRVVDHHLGGKPVKSRELFKWHQSNP